MDSAAATPAPYDGLADVYDAHFTDPKSLAENRAVARWLRPFVGDARHIVDLGCGTGLLLDLLPVAPAAYHGVDLSAGMLHHARTKHPAHRFVLGDIERSVPGVADGEADLVVSLFGSLSYCDLVAAHRCVTRLLAPGGRYFLMFCGPRYPSRPSFIDAGTARLKVHPAADVIDVYRPDAAWGMSWCIDALSRATPGWIYDAAIRLERTTVGRFMHDRCYFLVLTGRRVSPV
ncbi:MAG TPA: class I SAM-dependent methyltransferase [Gemmatimonadaceae bacterium]|nr:class I SAM-dependent methyltransferase [Gemmatimonadaceae bacterium]